MHSLFGGPHVQLPSPAFNPLTREWVMVSPHRAKRAGLTRWKNMPSIPSQPMIRDVIFARVMDAPGVLILPTRSCI